MKKFKNPFKAGDRITYKNDPDKEIYFVYAVYSDTEISLGLLDYPDTEQDYLTKINEILPVDKDK